MFVTLSESEEELRSAARNHGWDLDGIHFLELMASEDSLQPDSRYTMFHPSEVELTETTKAVLAEAERVKPVRLVFDSLSELRLMAQNTLRHRRQVLALKKFFSRQDATVLFIDDRTTEGGDMQLHSISHGVISLEHRAPEYGAMRRRLRIAKMRGRAFLEGYHDFLIRQGGLQVFPRIVAADHRRATHRASIKSGLESLDALLGGGLAKGTSTLLVGAAGTGKSSVASQYAVAAAQRGEGATIYLFDESVETFRERSRGLGMDIESLEESGQICLRPIDPAELTPGEFAHVVRAAVEEKEARLIVIDSLNGYLNAMPNERLLTLHLHELLSYLGHRGVTTLLLMAQHGIMGMSMQAPVDASYLADTVLLLRFFEALGEVRKGISVIKKRTGDHERTIRELRVDKGLSVGEPLRHFQGVLTGTPRFVSEAIINLGSEHDGS